MTEARATYLLPVKAQTMDGFTELTAYLRSLRGVDLVIVDGSPAHVFYQHACEWAAIATHVAPDRAIRGLNGKVRGVLTGLSYAHDKIIIADDDIRYDAKALEAVIRALDVADVVRPQNYFAPHAWHTILDTGRTLLNRITGGDWPGTLAVRRSALAAGYDADILFENLELVRTVRVRGGKELRADDIYVARRPPQTDRFFDQRVRQAYDEFARPVRLLAALGVVPAAALLRGKPKALLAAVALVAVAAEIGRRRNGGAKYFPALASIAAPLWLMERGVCAWIAVAMRLRYGGVPYAGTILKRAATPLSELKERAA